MIKVAILGYGTVGSGVFQIIKENSDIVNEKSGEEIDIKYVLDLREFPGDPCEDVLVQVHRDILHDGERTLQSVRGAVRRNHLEEERHHVHQVSEGEC